MRKWLGCMILARARKKLPTLPKNLRANDIAILARNTHYDKFFEVRGKHSLIVTPLPPFLFSLGSKNTSAWCGTTK